MKKLFLLLALFCATIVHAAEDTITVLAESKKERSVAIYKVIKDEYFQPISYEKVTFTYKIAPEESVQLKFDRQPRQEYVLLYTTKETQKSKKKKKSKKIMPQPELLDKINETKRKGIGRLLVLREDRIYL